MNYLAGMHVRAIEDCFREWGKVATLTKGLHWCVKPHNGTGLSVRAYMADAWLVLHADLDAEAGRANMHSALGWNALLDGNAKFSLSPATRSLRVRAEIPLDNEVSPESGLAAALSGFRQAASLAHNVAHQEMGFVSGSSDVRSPVEQASVLQELLADTGWPFTARPDGGVLVDLESRPDFHQALVKTEHDGSRRASVELAAWESPASASRHALAVLLLTAAGVIRMVRPVLEDGRDRIAARIEIRLAPDARPAFLDRAFSALSITCRLCAREANSLKNERIAEQYLAVRELTIQ